MPRFRAKAFDTFADKAGRIRDNLGRFGAFRDREIIENVMRVQIAQSMERSWFSVGATIGEDWLPHDLVETGELRSSMTVPYNLALLVYQKGKFYFGSEVEHAHYARQWGEYLKIDATALDGIKQALNTEVQRLVRMEL